MPNIINKRVLQLRSPTVHTPFQYLLSSSQFHLFSFSRIHSFSFQYTHSSERLTFVGFPRVSKRQTNVKQMTPLIPHIRRPHQLICLLIFLLTSHFILLHTNARNAAPGWPFTDIDGGNQLSFTVLTQNPTLPTQGLLVNSSVSTRVLSLSTAWTDNNLFLALLLLVMLFPFFVSWHVPVRLHWHRPTVK